MEGVRADIDALAPRIAAARRECGVDSAEYKALVQRMAQLREQLPKDGKKKEKESEPSYYDSRLATVMSLGLMGKAYPHKFAVTHTLPQVRVEFAPLLHDNGQRLQEACVSVAGRIINKRSSGSKLHFLTLQGDMETLQVISSLVDFRAGAEEFAAIHGMIKRGDIVGIEGHPCRSNTGELSIAAHHIVLLSTCFHMLPDDYFGLTDIEQRFRQRYLDLIVNRTNINIFIARAKIIQHIRDFFNAMNFIEVETPTLNQIAGGAAARPFVTFHNDLNQRMFLRIAPELYLKELVVGGMDRVFELGKQFRNEGIDLTHNPEFTSIEAYWAYHDYNDWMTVTEDLLHGLAIKLHGSPIVRYEPKDSEGKPLPACEFNFSKPFKRIRIIPALEKHLGVMLSNVDFETDEAVELLLRLCKTHNVECAPPFTAPRLLDALIAEFLEPECHDPCFLCDHPRVMSPLAKWHRENPRLTERFELFVNKKELVNAYTELNNPIVQREEFVKQMKNRDKGDDESMPIDEDFIRALEHALPPTGGWGMGIDRLVMFMTSQANIKEVLLFPAMKMEGKSEVSYPHGTVLNGQGVPLLDDLQTATQ